MLSIQDGVLRMPLIDCTGKTTEILLEEEFLGMPG
jgi:hypothetical protein